MRQQHGEQLPQHRQGRAPESYKTKLTTGGTGSGGTNYTGNLTSGLAVSPTYTPTTVSVSGTVYQDNNGNGIDDTGDVGISGVTMQLSGTTTGGVSVTATTTTDASGNYTFTTDSNGNALLAGTYQVTEIEPTGYYQQADNVGTVAGAIDGVVIPTPNEPECKIGSIVLTAGQSGINYNFAELNPFAQVTPAYPYSSTNPLTDVAFNESSVLAGATVNLATNTLDMWYTDEHALTLGVSSVTVQTANGSTTTNYNVTPLGSDPGSAINPSVGDTATTGTQAAVDASGRPLFPSLYITDITNNVSSTSGDWQFGGTPIAPTAVYGAWKPFSITVDETTSPATVTQTAANDPAANGWNLGAGADPVPATIAGSNAGYGAEVQWSLTSLYQQGLLVAGHSYRFYFIVHDGDQNKVGGDCGQAAFDFTYHGPVTIAGHVYNDQNGTGTYATNDGGVGGVTLTLTGTTTKGQSITATTVTAADGSYSFTTDSTGNLLSAGTYQVVETAPSGYILEGANAGTVNGTTDGIVISSTKIGTIALEDGNNGANYNFGLLQPLTISGTVYQDTQDTGSYTTGEPGIGGVLMSLSGTNVLGQPITATTVTAANGSYTFSKDSNGNPLLAGTYQIVETAPAGFFAGGTTVGTLRNAPVNWPQDFAASTSASGAGYVADAFKSNSDDIFTGGGSKDTSGVSQWQWTNQQPQSKDDIENTFGAIYADATSGHNLLLLSMDRYSNGGDSTLGVWAFQNRITENANGTFNGVHADGDILLTIDFASQAINVYRWTGNDATGSLTLLTPPASAALCQRAHRSGLGALVVHQFERQHVAADRGVHPGGRGPHRPARRQHTELHVAVDRDALE